MMTDKAYYESPKHLSKQAEHYKNMIKQAELCLKMMDEDKPNARLESASDGMMMAMSSETMEPPELVEGDSTLSHQYYWPARIIERNRVESYLSMCKRDLGRLDK